VSAVSAEERQLVTELASRLLAEGRSDALVAELRDSGLGAELWSDSDAMAALFELHGSLCATSGLLGLAVLRPADGAISGLFVLPVPGEASPPGRVLGASIVIDGVVFGAGAAEPHVVATDSGDILLVRGLNTEPVHGFDPTLGLFRVEGCVRMAECEPAAGTPAWDVLLARSARIVAHQLVGVAHAALAIATRHVQERHQFGRPIGAFQTVRHRLADALIAETGAREVLDCVDDSDPAVELLVVKALAGRAALIAVQAAQQVCGAMGFTEELGLHRFVRRAYLLDCLLGGSEAAEFELGSHVLATGHTPDRTALV
jgi:hypothetical protein